MEISVSLFHVDSYLFSSTCGTRPKVATRLNSIWIEANVHFDVTSGDNGTYVPVVCCVKDKLSPLQEIRRHSYLCFLIGGHINK